MDCNDKDLLQYLEGKASKEAEMHILTCKECSAAVRELSVFREVLPHYRESKRLLESLDDHVKTSEGQKVKSLPPAIEEMLKQAGGAERKIHPFRKPEKPDAMPGAETGSVRLRAAAIPRDITKAKKRKDKPEKGEK